MNYVRAFITFDVSANDWVVHLRRGGSFRARNRTEAIDAAMESLKADQVLRLIW